MKWIGELNGSSLANENSRSRSRSDGLRVLRTTGERILGMKAVVVEVGRGA